jgi:hypothetical protein
MRWSDARFAPASRSSETCNRPSHCKPYFDPVGLVYPSRFLLLFISGYRPPRARSLVSSGPVLMNARLFVHLLMSIPILEGLNIIQCLVCKRISRSRRNICVSWGPKTIRYTILPCQVATWSIKYASCITVDRFIYLSCVTVHLQGEYK